LVPQREVFEDQGAVGSDPAEEADEDEGDHAGHHRSGRPKVNVDKVDRVNRRHTGVGVPVLVKNPVYLPRLNLPHTSPTESARVSVQALMPDAGVGPMLIVIGLWTFLRAVLFGSAAVAIENLALRHQLLVLQRSVGRPRLARWDRILWVWLSRVWVG
jgi:hypothetical protein